MPGLTLFFLNETAQDEPWLQDRSKSPVPQTALRWGGESTRQVGSPTGALARALKPTGFRRPRRRSR